MWSRNGRLAATSIGLLAWTVVTAGCGGQAGIAGSQYHDPNPLPPDTLTVAPAAFFDRR